MFNSIRKKVILAIIAIVIAITVAITGMSIVFTKSGLLKTVEKDMMVVADMGDKLVTSKIILLKTSASAVAHQLNNVPDTQMRGALRSLTEEYGDFMSLTVLDLNGVVDAYGKSTTPGEFAQNSYARMAFAGEKVISTTMNGRNGELVFYVLVPMRRGRLLSATVSGMIFSDILSQFKIWDTGNLFIMDSEGVIIANVREDMVKGRYNFIEMAKTNEGAKSAGDITRKMIQGEKGIGRYYLFGSERVCAYRAVSGSDVGWTIGVAAPLSESPASNSDRGLILAGVIFMAFGIIVAILVSGSIARPFQIINDQNAYLEELNEIAKNSSEAKSHFLANMSHEMRTPLNAIIGLSELSLNSCDEKEKSGEANENLEKIYNAGVTLLGIVNDLLDISKIESGKFELVPVEYDVPSLINDIITLNILRIADKPVTFNLAIDETLPSRLLGDELRVKQIFNNLLSNAFKYTKEGSVELRVSFKRDGENVWLTARVEDTGIGIKEEDIARLFSEYNQVDVKSNRMIEGTGLGLSITKKMADMMGGAIEVESVYGRGSAFTVNLRQKFVTDIPIGAQVAENLKNFHYSENKHSRNSKIKRVPMPYAKVLMVDDVLTNLDVAKGMLKPYGMQVDCVTSGHQAIALIREEHTRYDAIFMDHMMPGMDGIEAVRIIREEIGTEYAKTVKIIALTANAIIGNEKMFLEHGFQAFLSKPIDIMRLDCTLKQWVRDKNLEKKFLEESNVLPESSEADNRDSRSDLEWHIEGLDLGKLLERFGGDEESLIHTLASYRETTPALLEKLRSLTEKGLGEYAIVVHGVKGSSYGICAETVGRLAEELEYASKNGDFEFVDKNNGALLRFAEKLIADIGVMLEGVNQLDKKPKRETPDSVVLNLLRESCVNYDMDGIDRAMQELESFEYEAQGGLVTWLRERVDAMDLLQIQDRLSA